MNKSLALFLFVAITNAAVADTANWIWKEGKAKAEKVEFRKTFTLTTVPKKARLMTTCDNAFTMTINGKQACASKDWEQPAKLNVAKFLKKGENEVLVQAENEGSLAGLLFELQLGKERIVSDKSWQARAPQGEWQAAVEKGAYGSGPWGKVWGKAGAPAPVSKPSPSTIATKALPGFKVEKLYTVPKATEGSWVGMTVDDKGRLITTDQHGAIYRVSVTDVVQVEKLNVKTKGGHGALYAFGSLYIMVGEGGQHGLHRLTDTNGDDQYDKEEFLVPINAGGEHGTHSAVLSPDKTSIYLIAGNTSYIPESVTQSRLANAWKEDHLLPRMADGRGHNRGRLAPGGFILKVSPDGKSQELICHGFRNQFDAAFSIDGELFTFDADMEYDIGAPWYRPTRVNHVVSGADWGWRNGTGKWPDYYVDTLPATINIGPGSPSGVSNGLGAKFPAKYQKAIFINDWTYGTMYAVHLEQDGASYKATTEEFVSGKPLALTDVVINPGDGHMYFMVGGRRSQSALYRISYVGKESTAPAQAATPTSELQLRRELEALHETGVGEEAIAKAWPQLSHADRFVRYAARVAIEKQPVAQWQSRVATESNSWGIIESTAALARMGSKDQQSTVLAALNKIDYTKAANDLLLGALRAYQLAFTRLGKPSAPDAAAVLAKLDGLFPHHDNFVNRELSQLLLYLDAPKAVSRTVQLILTAPDDEQEKILADSVLARNDRYAAAAKRMESFRPNVQQFALAFSLRSIKTGWTDADHASYFSWYPRAKTWQGGNSFAIFIENARKEALANVTDVAKRAEYDTASSKSLTKPRAISPAKGPGRAWTVDGAVTAVKDNLAGRNFKSGENLFHATACASCHRFAGQGMGIGPDLTGSVNRYTLRDMLENIIEPSKVISDQYGSTHFTMNDGSEIIGRLGTEEDGVAHIMTNPFSPDSNVDVELANVKTQKPYPVSSMPPGLVYPLNPDELSDLIAYIYSAGDPEHAYFTKASYQPEMEGAKALFNGTDLSGWKGDPALWSVKDGVIYGTSIGNKLKANTFLVWDGEVGDFHLSFEAKCTGNNSGMMYRSQWLNEADHRLRGYQADIHPNPPYVAMLYAEQLDKRGIVARRGQKVEVGTDGKPKVVGKTCEVTPVKTDEWQTYEIICRGNHMIHKLNGEVAVDIIDNHPNKQLKGLIGMQLHAGPAMECWLRNVRLKEL